jgi:hypothetical protein
VEEKLLWLPILERLIAHLTITDRHQNLHTPRKKSPGLPGRLHYRLPISESSAVASGGYPLNDYLFSGWVLDHAIFNIHPGHPHRPS